MPPALTLYGYGKMAESIAKGLSGKIPLEITGRDHEKILAFITTHQLQATPLFLDDSPLDLTGRHVLLAVKPYALGELAFCGEAEAIYSILAGVSLERLRAKAPAKAHIRAMPNLAAALQASCTALCGDEALRSSAEEIFSALGTTIWLDKESKLDAASAIAGSGPAYLALIAEALSDAGVREGLTRAEATQLTQGLFKGVATLLPHTHPAKLKEEVASPAGTTIEALAVLENRGVRGAFMEAVRAAFLKAQKL